MSAFGQSVENSLADDYAKKLSRYVSAIVAQERAWLEDRLKELTPGETWCQHDTESYVGAYGTWTRTLSGHVLPEGKVCSILGPRVQWGPAPAPWPPTEGP